MTENKSSMETYRESLTDPKSSSYIPKFSMMPPLSLDYTTWDLEEAVAAEMKQARQDAGISRVDTWSFDQFVSAIIVNGLLHTELHTHPLHDEKAWEYFKAANPKVLDSSFEEAIIFVTTALGEYRHNPDAFFAYRGAEVLNRALETFVALFPHLKRYESYNSKGLRPSRADDFLDTVENGEIPTERHYRERQLFGISWNDSADLAEHLSGVFAIGFEILANNGHTHPGDLTVDEWDYTLRKLARGFKNYHLYGTPLEAWVKDKFVERFTNFWD